MDKKSTRHHFIPKFLIKGFTNSNGLLYIYDKHKDTLHRNPRSPKSVFFENDRNTITFPDKRQNSIIEDYFYQQLDNESAITLIKMQSLAVKDIDLSDRHLAGSFLFFLINLFWRLPITDFAFEDLIDNVEIVSNHVNPEELRTESWFRKTSRSGLFKHTIEEIGSTEPANKTCFEKLSEFDHDVFLLGDYPTLYKSVPKKFSDLGYMDFMFAVSSKRIYSRTVQEILKFDTNLAKCFNIFILEQSNRYIISGNYELLEKSIVDWKRVNEENKLSLIPYNKFIFNLFNKKNNDLYT